MHAIRQGRRPKITVITTFIFALVLSMLLYTLYFQLSDIYKKRKAAGDRCQSELVNAKHQLDNVLEYKNKMDLMITELRQDCSLQREALKEFSNSYLVIKKSLDICETQAEVLEVECKDLKVKLQNTKDELTACKKTPG